MLDIVITHYKEAWEIGEKMFRMIGLQRCINFGDISVTVINDGGQRLPEDQLATLPYPVRQIDIPHGGISAARNAGIDNATGEWIMFCDFDDTFASVYSLREIMNVLHGDRYDMLWCKILAEDYINGHEQIYYVPDKQRFVFCHGKVYRTAFLREANIRFDEELVFNEDSCFNAVIIARTYFSCIGEIRSPMPLYVWCRREQSVTNSGRQDEATYGHFRRNLKVVAEYEGTGDDRYDGMVTRTAYDAYYMVHSKRNSMEMRRKIQEEFTPWIAERVNAFGNVSNELLKEIRKVARMELVEPDDVIPDSFRQVAQWVGKIAESNRIRNTEYHE